MSDKGCEFDDLTHTYRINRRMVPSVTRVLGDLLPCWRASEWYLERGRAVHAAAALIALGKDFEYDQQIEGHVRALRRFFHEVAPVVCGIELPVYSEAHQYAGRMDLLTRKPGSQQLMIIDFKSTLTASVPYQLAAYANAYQEAGVNWGCGVGIHDDGTYAMGLVYDLRRYKAGFLALLAAYNVRRECGIKTEE